MPLAATRREARAVQAAQVARVAPRSELGARRGPSLVAVGVPRSPLVARVAEPARRPASQRLGAALAWAEPVVEAARRSPRARRSVAGGSRCRSAASRPV